MMTREEQLELVLSEAVLLLRNLSENVDRYYSLYINSATLAKRATQTAYQFKKFVSNYKNVLNHNIIPDRYAEKRRLIRENEVQLNPE